MHWLVQVIHLLVGLGAIGQAIGLAARIASRGPVARGERQPLLAEEG